MPVDRVAPPAAPADDGLLHAMAAVAEATCSAAALTDADDRVVWVNPAFTRVTGWTGDEARGRQLAALLQRAAGDDAEPWPQPRPLGQGAALEQLPLIELRRRCGAAYWARVDLRRLPAACAPLAYLHLHSDTSDSVLAGQRAHEFERWLQLAGSVYGMGLWQIGVRDGTLVWDANLKHMFGLAPQAPAPNLHEIADRYVHEEDRPLLADALRQVPPVDAHAELELRIRRLDGQWRTIVSRHAAIEGERPGRSERVLGAVVDITALRRAEGERDRIGRRMQLVAETVGLGLWEYEPASRRSTWNDRMYALFGQTRESFRDRLWYEVLHPDDVAGTRQAFERTVATGAPFDVEFRVLHGDGQTRWLAARGRGERGATGAIARVLGVNWDISDTKRIEQAALAAERNARDLLERMLLATSATGFGLWESDERGERLVWDAQMYRLFGRPPGSEAPQRIWDEAVPAEDAARVEALFHATALGGPGFEVEFPVRLPDGSLRWLASRGMQRQGRSGRELLGVNWDISERRVAEAALRAQEAAERANTAKTEFLSRMSHELRTPLNAILGFAQLLEIDPRQPLAPAQRERVGHISQAGWHLLELINEVLDLARVEAGATRLEIDAVSLAPLLRECLALIDADAQRRGLRLALQLEPGLAPSVRADRTRLKQILLNLLSNAVKYNRDQGRIDVVATAAAEGAVAITVRDTGRGMNAAQMSELFQPFNRLGLESASVPGTGIGLTIALKLAEQMGATLQAASEPGVGSEFRLTLPCLPDAAAAATPASLPARSDIAGCVLCVEDNADNAELVKQWLSLRPNLTLFHARDGASARVMAVVCQPDLILLDMRLPDTTGAQLAQGLRALPGLADVPCVAVSANALAADIAAARAAGIGEYLTKPLDGAALLDCIDRLLAPSTHRR